MTSVINTSTIIQSLRPGVKKWWGDGYGSIPEFYRDLLEVEESRKAYEDVQNIVGMGVMPIVPEGDNVNYDAMSQGYLSRHIKVQFGLGFIITLAQQQYEQYPELAQKRTRALARAEQHTKNFSAANLYNRGFNANFLGGDGVSLFSASHPTSTGTQGNIISADLDEKALEDMVILAKRMRDDRGNIDFIMPDTLLVPNELEFEVQRVLKTDRRPGTANNDLNVLYAGNYVKKIVICPYLTDTDAFFMKTTAENGPVMYMGYETDMDTQDTDNYNIKFSRMISYSCFWSDWRAVIGSAGV